MAERECPTCHQEIPQPLDGECCVFRGHHIPGCWGCATNGHENCTCSPAGKRTRGKGAFMYCNPDTEENIEDEPPTHEVRQAQRTFLRLVEKEVDRG